MVIEMKRTQDPTKFSIAFRIQEQGADIADPRKVQRIKISFFVTERAINEILPPSIKALLAETQIKKADDYSGRMMTLEMQSQPKMGSSERTWLETAKSQARPGINDIGLELTPRNGIQLVEGGETIIAQLQKEGWIPCAFEVSEKKSTEQRKVVDAKEPLKKIIFTLSFKRSEPTDQAIVIPEAILEVLVRQSTWEFAHVWYNRAIIHSVQITFTVIHWAEEEQNRPQPKWVITL